MAPDVSKAAEALLVLLYRLSGDGVGPVPGEEAKRLFGDGFNKALLELLGANCLAHGAPARTIALSVSGRQKARSLRLHKTKPAESHAA